MAVTNYYEELGLSAEMGTDEIKDKLDQLETVYNQRLLNEPEKANEMLLLINKAKEVFATPDNKRAYDEQLEESGDERLTSFNKWYSAAVDYLNRREYDLAKSAIEKASQFYYDSDDNSDYLFTSSRVYYNNKDYERATKLINDAIILAPSRSEYYRQKGLIAYATGRNKDAAACFSEASSIAHDNNDQQNEGAAQAALASVLMYELQDFAGAEAAATIAVELGDDTGIGQEILAELEKPLEMDVSDIDSILYKKYNSEPLTLADEINEMAMKLVDYMKTQGIAFRQISNRNMEEVYPSDDIMHSCKYSIVLEESGDWCLYGEIHKRTNDTRAYIGDEKTRTEYGRMPDLPDDLLREFDFSGAVTFSDRHDHGIVNSMTLYDSFPLPYKNTRLTRLHIKKGRGLLKRLNEILASLEKEAIRKAEEDRKASEKKAEDEKRAMEWKAQGKCRYCGGEFKGFLSKKCSNCGKPKDY